MNDMMTSSTSNSCPYVVEGAEEQEAEKSSQKSENHKVKGNLIVLCLTIIWQYFNSRIVIFDVI